MTDKQIRDAKCKLPQWRDMTDNQKQEYAELACRDMINSILIYGSKPVKDDGSLDRYLSMYYKKGESTMYYIGEKRVRNLIEEQKKDFAKATVTVGVYTDHEGCSYNSCNWGD